MYLIDTNVISELRKRKSANPNVVAFFTEMAQQQTPIFLSVITMGELRRGVDLIRYRRDRVQAEREHPTFVELPSSPSPFSQDRRRGAGSKSLSLLGRGI